MHGPRSARRRRSLLGFGQLAPTGPSAERPGRLCPGSFRPDVLASPGATDRACRYIHTDDDDMTLADPLPVRRCLECDRELPAGSRPSASSARRPAGAATGTQPTPAPSWTEEPRVRLHWHGGLTTVLWGDYRAGYWRGPDGCPPECPGLTPPTGGWASTNVPGNAAGDVDYRPWTTDLHSGRTTVGWNWESVIDSYYPPDGYITDAEFSFGGNVTGGGTKGSAPERFYVWASVIQDGRVVATDYSPDVGWLDTSVQTNAQAVSALRRHHTRLLAAKRAELLSSF